MDPLQKQLAAAGDDSDGRMTGTSEGQAANAIVTLAPPPAPLEGAPLRPPRDKELLPSPAEPCRVLLSHAASCRVMPSPAESCRVLPSPAESASWRALPHSAYHAL